MNGGAPRAAAMREAGEFYCPDWCAQPDDEHQFAAHLTAYASIITEAGVVVQARAAMGWGEDIDRDGVHLDVSREAMVLTERENDAVTDLLTTQFGRVSHSRIYLDPSTWQWAYPGADGDINGADEVDEDEECCGDEEDTCHDCPILMVPR